MDEATGDLEEARTVWVATYVLFLSRTTSKDNLCRQVLPVPEPYLTHNVSRQRSWTSFN